MQAHILLILCEETVFFLLAFNSVIQSIVTLYKGAVVHQQVTRQRRWKYGTRSASVKRCEFRRRVICGVVVALYQLSLRVALLHQ